jgi:hypothetical protein
LAVRFFLAFVIVLALIGATAFLVRRFGSERLAGSSARGRQPRLAVIDAAAVDGRRRLILIRRDNVEHLLMIGGPSDVVVEANIVRAASAPRDAGPPRPPVAASDTLPRAVPLGEGNMWPLQPEPAPPPRPRPPVDEPMQWHAEAEPLPPSPSPPRRAEPRAYPHPDSRPEPRQADPLAGLAAELSRVQPDTPASRPRPTREREPARAPRPERARSAPAAAAPAEEPLAPNTDQNLAEMAQRLEAALRRPKPTTDAQVPERAARAPAMAAPAMPEPVPASAPVQASAMESPPERQEEVPPVPPNPTAVRAAPAASATAKPAAQKSVYDSLEQEMASLLGRPNNKT